MEKTTNLDTGSSDQQEGTNSQIQDDLNSDDLATRMEALKKLRQISSEEYAQVPSGTTAAMQGGFHETPIATNSSIAPVVNIAKKAAEYIPSNWKDEAADAAAIAASVGAGAVGRKLMPQEKVFGTPEYERAQAARAADLANEKPAYNAAVNAANILSNAQSAHATTGDTLRQQLAMAEAEHANNLQDLAAAHQEHGFAHSRSVEDEFARRYPNPSPTPAPMETTSSLTPQNRGGDATMKYALQFGATPEEASKVPSQSSMQRVNIPGQTSAWEKISGVAPEFEFYNEHPLILGPEGKQILEERLAQNASAQSAADIKQKQQQVQEDNARKAIRDDIAAHKAAAQNALENARENARLSAKTKNELARSVALHETTEPMTAAQQGKQQQIIDDWDALKKRIASSTPDKYTKSLAKIGTKIFPRFVPMAGAAFAPIEAEAAKKDWEAGAYPRAATHALGAVGALAQATGNPLLMGLGDVAQVPSVFLSGLDTYRDLNKR